MADPLQVEVVSAQSRVWRGEARQVNARTLVGEIGVLSGHSPLLGAMPPGVVEVVPAGSGDSLVVAVDGGFLSVARNQVSILAEHIELAEDIQADRARSDLTAAQEDEDLRSPDERVARRAQVRVEAAQARVDASQKVSGRA